MQDQITPKGLLVQLAEEDELSTAALDEFERTVMNNPCANHCINCPIFPGCILV